MFSIIILQFACSKNNSKLKLSNSEAFAFDVGDGWEVNGTVVATGFQQKKNKNIYKSKLYCFVNLITSSNDTLKKIFSDTLENKQKNKFIDIPVEVQIELDRTFETGSYKLLFNIRDEYSKQKKIAEAKFNLTKE